MEDLLASEEYKRFRSNVPQRKVCVDASSENTWTLYDAGPRDIQCPLIFLPPVSGQADIFFQQLLALSAVGFRVISVQYPVYWTVAEFCRGFRYLLDQLNIDKVHLFGASLGGFLAQKFVERTRLCPRVQSIILCNSFNDSASFHLHNKVSTFWMTPSIILKKQVTGITCEIELDEATSRSKQFMRHSLDSLSQQELASRLTLNCSNDYVQPQRLRDLPIMIIDAFDAVAFSNPMREELKKCYPDAKIAQLKSGGNFPYLSRPAEINLFIQSIFALNQQAQGEYLLIKCRNMLWKLSKHKYLLKNKLIHLNQFINTKFSALTENGELFKLYKIANAGFPSQ